MTTRVRSNEHLGVQLKASDKLESDADELKARLHQAEEGLRSAHDEMELIFDNISSGIRVINSDYTIRLINQAFADMSGVTPIEATGRKCWAVFPSPFCRPPNAT